MDTYLLERAGFTAQAKEIELSADAKARQQAEAAWIEEMRVKYPPISRSARAILRRQATVHRPVPLDDVSLDGIDLEQAHDELYALSNMRDSSQFPAGYEAVRLECPDGKVAVLVIGLIRKECSGGYNRTHKFLVAVIGTTREKLETYAEIIRPETHAEAFNRQLQEIRDSPTRRPHETPRRERAARIARLLDKKVRYILITLVVAAVVTVIFSHISAFAAALSFVLVFLGSLFGSRLVHNAVLKRAGLAHHDNACWRGHYPPPLKASSTVASSVIVEHFEWM